MEMPQTGSNSPLQVTYKLFILDIYGVEYDDYKVGMSIYLVLSWLDARIDLKDKNSSSSSTTVDASFIDKIWTPDLYFYNTRDSNHHEKNPRLGLWLETKGKNNTTVTIAKKLELSLTCPMNVSTFPFDSHICTLKFSSFARKADEIEFVSMSGSEQPDALLDDRKLQDFSANASYIKGSKTLQKAWLSSDGQGPGNQFSIGGIEIRLVRDATKFSSIYYLPTTMFTLTSWVSFLLPPTSYPARTAILVTIFLCQSGVFSNVIQNTPNQDAGMTALEIWCLSNIIFVFQALLAYVVILVRLGWSERRGPAGKKKVDTLNAEGEITGHPRRNWKVEGILFIWVSGTVVIFNICYWSIYKA